MYLTRQESRNIDRKAVEQFGISGLVLMENAGRGAVDTLQRLEIVKPEIPVGLVCGKGNNGGDGFVMARHLKIRGLCPTVFLLADPKELTGDAGTNYNILRRCNVPIMERTFPVAGLERFGVLIDAMLGTGAAGIPREPFAKTIRSINTIRKESGVKVIAIDIPSGLDADTGLPSDPTVFADYTLTFYASKVGFTKSEAAKYLGTVIVQDIGLNVHDNGLDVHDNGLDVHDNGLDVHDNGLDVHDNGLNIERITDL
ncbi:MAG: NAD(P)H-hydrate epimerase [Planctomycetaceae bacterium]|jgi:NAD(P)H-hydrate epimerase|nr:NAD(P)H-hydrate epimerase [Planctomycetaceae bacterium]